MQQQMQQQMTQQPYGNYVVHTCACVRAFVRACVCVCDPTATTGTFPGEDATLTRRLTPLTATCAGCTQAPQQGPSMQPPQDYAPQFPQQQMYQQGPPPQGFAQQYQPQPMYAQPPPQA